ncbi:MAG: hypothetical protein UY16_C0030G0010 [Candidatus Gottesmanbacteria bacterium GW2011_GWA2_47_9]|uniref:Uncharacterized protein n=1 Tax=Candidatus Gottesmanbacteria bacterium GW2011_GWA2_47_9 TaxID=1618445 RepID=A0A0G1WYN9_9BACT|nr:MAG: hypothetical protein UY16_C0030G0010 [Candidatus Gottesmanbacteria bacterium GW2011_GWA2_47_9]
MWYTRRYECGTTPHPYRRFAGNGSSGYRVFRGPRLDEKTTGGFSLLIVVHHLVPADGQEAHGAHTHPLVYNPDVASDGKCPFARKLLVKCMIAKPRIVGIFSKPPDTLHDAVDILRAARDELLIISMIFSCVFYF